MQIYQKVSMLPEDGSYESLRQDIRTLSVGRNVLDRNYTGRTNSRTKWKRTSMCFVLAELSGLDASLIAPLLSTKTLIVFCERDGTGKDATDFAKITSLTPSPSATYSASVVESVTILCVLLIHQTVALPRVTTTPCLLYTSPSPRDGLLSRMPSSA